MRSIDELHMHARQTVRRWVRPDGTFRETPDDEAPGVRLTVRDRLSEPPTAAEQAIRNVEAAWRSGRAAPSDQTG